MSLDGSANRTPWESIHGSVSSTGLMKSTVTFTNDGTPSSPTHDGTSSTSYATFHLGNSSASQTSAHSIPSPLPPPRATQIATSSRAAHVSSLSKISLSVTSSSSTITTFPPLSFSYNNELLPFCSTSQPSCTSISSSSHSCSSFFQDRLIYFYSSPTSSPSVLPALSQSSYSSSSSVLLTSLSSPSALASLASFPLISSPSLIASSLASTSLPTSCSYLSSTCSNTDPSYSARGVLSCCSGTTTQSSPSGSSARHLGPDTTTSSSANLWVKARPPTSTGSVSQTVLLVNTKSSAGYYPTPSTWQYRSSLAYASTFRGQGMTTWTIVTTGVPSTGVAQPSDQESSLPPGAIVGIALAILGVMAFAVFWIFCANRRRRLNTPQREADGLPAHNSVTRTLLDDEMNGTGSEGLEKPGRVMEERFAGILDAHRMVSDPIDNKYHGVQLNDSAQRVARTSHTLLQRELSLSPPHHFQSPPSAYVPPRFKSASARRTDPPESEASAWLGEYSIVHSTSSNLRHPSDITTIDAGGLDSPSSHAQPHHALEQGSAEGILPSSSIFPTTSPMSSTFPPPPPPPAYVPSVTGERVQRRASPGPDAAAWFGGYSIAHWSGSNSHSNPHSHPSEELPVSGRVTSVSSQAHSYGTGLGSAFSSHEGSLYGRALRIRSSSHGSSNGPLLSASSHAASSQGPPNSPSRRSSSGERRRSMASVPPTSYGGKRKRRSSDVDDRIGGHRSRHGSSSGSGDERSVGSIRAFLGRLRGGRDGTSRQFDGGSGTFGQSLASTVAMEERRQRETAERLEEERVRQQYRQTARGREPVYSFILSNPDSQPPSPSIRSTNSTHMNSGLSPNESQYHPLRPWTGQHPHNSDASLPFDTWPLWLSPHELPEGSRNAEDLLDPRLRLNDAAIGQEGRSLASLRDFLDYSRPIGAIMSNRLHSVTTFGTQETRGSRSVSAQASLGDLAAGDAHVTINSLD